MLTKITIFSFFLISTLPILSAQEIKPIPRLLPEKGVEISAEDKEKITESLKGLQAKVAKINHPLKADVEVYAKAVSFALKFGEFYKKGDVAKTLKLLKNAHERADQLLKNSTPWVNSKGHTVRGFYSEIDGSPQPYIVEIPENLDLTKKQPLYIWLHGRGNNVTDLHFMAGNGKDNESLKFPNENVITVHPFGRQCIGYKSAAETDIFEMLNHLKNNYKIDDNRIVLMGFSMGGAGAWHLGAHYADKWTAVHAGAGFVDTAIYQKITDENAPAWYVKKLWGMYDVPDYVENLFNIPVIAYTGELDKQIESALIMKEAYKKYGKSLTHIVGAKMEHKYDDASMKKVLDSLRPIVEKGRNPFPKELTLQTKTLKYNKSYWIELYGLQEHWNEARVEAKVEPKTINLKSKNVTQIKLSSPWDGEPLKTGTQIKIDDEVLTVEKESDSLFLSKESTWKFATFDDSALSKKPGLQGPIFDAYMSPFLVVTPSKKSSNKQFQTWLDFEINYLTGRWQSLFRGTLRMKMDSEVTEDDIKNYHLILWGSPETNSVYKKIADKLPVQWENGKITANGKTYEDTHFTPQFIYPNPLNIKKYIVVNSCPTFRENHDKTNSQQNPKLPDWAIIDLRQPPDGEAAGKVVDANFFNENWQWKK